MPAGARVIHTGDASNARVGARPKTSSNSLVACSAPNLRTVSSKLTRRAIPGCINQPQPLRLVQSREPWRYCHGFCSADDHGGAGDIHDITNALSGENPAVFHKGIARVLDQAVEPTGRAQSKGFRGELVASSDLANRVRYDELYVASWSLALDLSILLHTVRQVVSPPRSAY